MDPAKDTLKSYLQIQRDALLWKLDGLGERDLRWPMTPTGSNLLGIVKHVASVEAGYLGEVFDRPFREPMPWAEPGSEDNDDMWATAGQSKEWIELFYRRVWEHSDATIDQLDLDTVGKVGHWRPENRETTLHRVLVHVIAETARHAGQVDIIREMIDGQTGWLQ